MFLQEETQELSDTRAPESKPAGDPEGELQPLG